MNVAQTADSVSTCVKHANDPAKIIISVHGQPLLSHAFLQPSHICAQCSRSFSLSHERPCNVQATLYLC